MNSLIVSTMLRTISKVCPFLLRRYYTRNRLDLFLKFDISASGDGAVYNFASQEGSCWLNAINFSPFDFTIDRMEIRVVLDGVSFSFARTLPVVLRGPSCQRILAQGKSPMSAEYASRAQESRRATIE